MKRTFIVVTVIITSLFFLPSIQAQWEQLKNWKTQSNQFVTCLKHHENMLYAGTYGGGIFSSSDNGNNWQGISKGLSDSIVYSILFLDSNIFASTFKGVFLSQDDGLNWTSKSTGITNLQIRALVNQSDTIYTGTWGGGIFRTTNNGNDWDSVNKGFQNKLIITLFATENMVFAGTFGGGIYRTTNNGNNWDSVNNGLTVPMIRAFTIVDNKIIVASQGGGLFYSSDDGNKWEKIKKGVTDSIFFALVSMGKNIFAGTESRGVSLSKDNGESWNEINVGLSDKNIRALSIHGDYIFAGTYNDHIYRAKLSDFIEINNPPNISSLKNIKIQENKIEEISLFLTDEYLDSLLIIPISLNQNMIRNENLILSGSGDRRNLKIIPDSNKHGETIVIISVSDNFFTVYDTINVIIEEINEISWSETKDNYFSLCPNPATDFLEISYSPSIKRGLGSVSEQNIEIFSVLGTRLLSSPVNLTPTLSMLGEGVRIDVSSLPQGIYFVKVGAQVGKFVKL